MLIALQLPLADARCFLDTETHRLKTPAWPIPELYREFVRGFGGVGKRARGGLEEWQGEGVFCDAARAIRFQIAPGKPPEAAHTLFANWRVAFRRFLYDGTSVGRFEAGVAERRPAGSRGRQADYSELLRGVLNLTIHIPAGVKGQFVTSELALCGDALAGHYLRATTERKGQMPQLSSWWLKAGELQLIVEYTQPDLETFPSYTRLIETSLSKDIHLHFGYLPHRGRMIGVWAIGAPAHVSAETRDQLRRLRIHLSRLHSERQCLKQILRLISRGKIQAKRGTATGDRLQKYLQDAVAQLSRQSRFGLPQSKLLNAAFEVEDTVNEGERVTLLNQLSDVRKNVFRSVSDYTVPEQPSTTTAGVEVFLSYAHEDETLCNELRKHLKILQRLGILSSWYDRQILPGMDWAHEINSRLDSANLVLLLVSSDFLDSDYCFGIEMKRAFERSAVGQAVVVPVILRPCAWQMDPLLAKLQAVPKDAKPVVGWENRDEAFTNVAEAIGQLAQKSLAAGR